MKINFEFFKEMYLKYQTLITLAVSTLFFCLACFWSPFMLFAWVLLGATFLFSNIQTILCYIIYFIMFSRNTIFFVGVGIIGFVVILVKYIIDLVKKRVETYKIPLIFTTVFCLFFMPITLFYPEMFHRYHTEFQGIVQGLLFIGILYVCYLIFCYKDKIKIGECINFLFYGIVASAFVCLVLYFIPSAKIAFYNENRFIYTAVKDLIFLVDVDCKRLMLLSYHANHLASYCMYIMTFSGYMLMNSKFNDDKKKYLYYAGMIVISAIIGVLTMSKAFLILTALIMLYLAIYFIIKLKKKSLYIIVPAFLVCLVCVFAFKGVFLKIINRFLNYEKGQSLFDIITTGRSAIWENYIRDFLSSPWKMLFGNGLFQVEIIAIGPHNMFIEILFRVGIVGLLLLGVLCFLYVREADNKIKFSFKRFMPLFIYLVHSIQEANFDERFLFLIFAIMLLYEQKYTAKECNVNKEVKTVKTLEQIDQAQNVNINEN